MTGCGVGSGDLGCRALGNRGYSASAEVLEDAENADSGQGPVTSPRARGLRRQEQSVLDVLQELWLVWNLPHLPHLPARARQSILLAEVSCELFQLPVVVFSLVRSPRRHSGHKGHLRDSCSRFFS